MCENKGKSNRNLYSTCILNHALHDEDGFEIPLQVANTARGPPCGS
jgi:hypothetical protein